MFNFITTIQEITLQSYTFGIYNYLSDKRNMRRDDIFNVFEGWGKEFEESPARKDEDYYEAIDKFIEEKFMQIKMADTFPHIGTGTYITYEGGVYKVTGFTNRGISVKEIASPANEWVIVEIGFDERDQIKVIDNYEEIMDGTNGHNSELVDKINHAWNTKREEFCPILRILYERDIDEITDCNAFMTKSWLKSPECKIGDETGNWDEYNKMVLSNLINEWDFYAYTYLMRIADDTDLKTILNFLHYDV